MALTKDFSDGDDQRICVTNAIIVRMLQPFSDFLSVERSGALQSVNQALAGNELSLKPSYQSPTDT